MHLPRFRYLAAASGVEAARLLKEHGPAARLAAGGTDLYVRMKYGLVKPEVVISLKKAAVRSPIRDAEGNLHIDPLTTLAEVGRSHLIRKAFPLVSEAALSVGSGQIRHMATLGGNICLENRCLYYNQSHAFQFTEPCFKRAGDLCYLFPGGKKCFALFMADTVPALISLGVQITLTDGGGRRSLALEEFYTGDALRPLSLQGSEVVEDIMIPARESLFGTAFAKFSLRGALEFAGLTMAAVLTRDDDGRIGDSRIAASALSPGPVRLKKVEAALKGQRPAMDLWRLAGEVAASEVAPVPHHGYSAAYLKKLLALQTRRLLETALTGAGAEKKGGGSLR